MSTDAIQAAALDKAKQEVIALIEQQKKDKLVLDRRERDMHDLESRNITRSEELDTREKNIAAAEEVVAKADALNVQNAAGLVAFNATLVEREKKLELAKAALTKKPKK